MIMASVIFILIILIIEFLVKLAITIRMIRIKEGSIIWNQDDLCYTLMTEMRQSK